jgi:fatty acyl-CoA reductase
VLLLAGFYLSVLPQVSKVYLLVRGKKGLTAQQRVQKLLCGPLFHQLHQQAAASNGPNVFSRVCVVQGDLEQPGLGLTQQDREALQEQVEVIIHSAAVLTLDAHIQSALR